MSEPRESSPITRRRRFPWPWWRRAWREILWALDLDDGSGDGSPSLTKWLALMTALVAFVAILKSLPVSGTQVTLIVIGISAAFGRSMWKHWLSRGTWSFGATDTTSRAEHVLRQQIEARRKEGAEDGTEPTD